MQILLKWQLSPIPPMDLRMSYVAYSWKYWRELNLAVGPKFTFVRILAGLNLAVWYGITIHNIIILYASKKFWRILISSYAVLLFLPFL